MRNSGPMVSVLLLVLAGSAEATEEIPIAVMEFDAKGGVEQSQVDALGDLLAAELRRVGRYRVIGQSDIRTALRLEEKKALLGCGDDSCLAEIGGALGVAWVISGNVSRFGDRYLLNLKLMDVERVVVVARVSYKADQDQAALIDLLPKAVNNLLFQAPPAIRPAGLHFVQVEDGGYRTWGHVTFWSGLGLAAFGGLALWQASVAADDFAYDGARDARDRNKLWNGLAPTGLMLGSALILTGSLLWAFAPDDHRPSKSVAFGLGPTGNDKGWALGLSGRW